MSTHRPRPDGRVDAERLLRGDPTNAGIGPDPLADLLAAASAPARDGELDGEQAAVAAFREARLGHVPQPRRKPMLKLMLANALATKVAAAAVGATVLGGAAVAASTGALPFTGGDGSTVSATATPSATVTTPEVAVASPGATVSASLLALCRTYATATATSSVTAPDSPSMTTLITAAGGRDKVGPFCAQALQAQVGATLAPGAQADTRVGPGGVGVGVGASAGPNTGVSVTAGPGGLGVGATAAGTAAQASAAPGGLGVGATAPRTGAGAQVGSGGASLGAAVPGVGVGASAGPNGVGLEASVGSTPRR
ncbi:hypothetical protein MXD59_22555 [Frankia sp. Ag45/Mut15]|uniref:Uncharacterized protein n=1 Tax=Frankia umida TaxID=573489 RepID=A0ABT0K407_9ACTN|nr:hypothetical protein [Frankia umida]MCK9878510.1 hypothetical protein [Frankia umida]